MEVINALGRRKTAVARIYMKVGNGNITVNKRDYKEYFPTSILHYVVEQPLTVYSFPICSGSGGSYLHMPGLWC